MDPLSRSIYIIIIVLCIFLSAFYSASETAFGSISKYKYKIEAESGSRTAKLVLWLYEHFNTTLIAILVGNNIVNLAGSTLLTLLFLDLFKGTGLMDFWVSLIASVSMTLVLYLLGESIPKVAAKLNPDRFARFAAYPLMFCYVLFFPLTMLFHGISKLFGLIFRTKDNPAITEEDFANAVEHGEKKGIFEANESDIVQASLDFTETAVRDVLTPKNKMFMIDLKDLSKDKLLAILKKTNYSRIPCYYENDDKILGILIVKNYLNAYFKDKNVSLVTTLEKPYFITPGVKMDDLIDGFRNRKTQIAIVRKEGKVVGMVTSEDVLEELVGNISETNKIAKKEVK